MVISYRLANIISLRFEAFGLWLFMIFLASNGLTLQPPLRKRGGGTWNITGHLNFRIGIISFFINNRLNPEMCKTASKYRAYSCGFPGRESEWPSLVM
jgi:hypothetical protein